MMPLLPEQLRRDVELVESVQAVPAILDIVCQSTGMRFAVVSRVTDSHWVACSVLDDLNFGVVSGDELELESTFCHSVRQSSTMVIMDHVDEDVQYCKHPTPARYGFQSYISVPIVLGDGSFFGTLCALDPEPRAVNRPEIIQMFTLFADLIGKQVEVVRTMQITRESLNKEQELSALREQFIAVLGHDLRTPLSSLSCGIELLSMDDLDADSVETLDIMRRSSAHMAGLIDDVMDFARGRLGSGMSLEYVEGVSLEQILTQVVAELQAMHPERIIEAAFDAQTLIDCDARRLSQLVSNLLGNALAHGDPDGVVRLVATTVNGQLQLEVINQGTPISLIDQGELFKPFVRSASSRASQGLGLGLFIAHCIATAHGGSIEVKSDEQDTRFITHMPLQH